MTLEGRLAVVTGGGRGIGAACARALAAEGAHVVITARTLAEIEEVAAEVGGAAVPCDVGDPASVAGMAARVGPADILVNNAGTAVSAPIKRLEPEEWERVLRVNATGTFLCTRAFLPGMMERGWGRVINVASTAGRIGARYISAYSASKHAVVGFTRSAADEAAASGVTVNAVCPGYVDTAMARASVANIVEKTGRSEEEALRSLTATSPQRRLIEPEEVAYLVACLCHPLARGINGQAIVLDGGAVQR